MGLCLLIGAFSPLTFKVIIDRYVLTAILFIVFVLFCSVFLCSFFCSLCDLMTIFSVMFAFLFSVGIDL